MSFGGGGGGTNTVTQQTQLPGWVQDFGIRNMQTAQNLTGQPYTAYPGQTLAPFNADQTAAMDTIRNAAGATQPLYSTAEGWLTNLPQTVQSFESPYLKQVEGDVTSNLQRQGTLNAETIAGNAVNANAYGGTRQGVATALNASETQRNIGQAVNAIQQQGWNTALDSVLRAAPTLTNIAGAGQNALFQGAGAELSAGGLEQGQDQAGLSQDYQKWQQAMNDPYMKLAIMQSALAGTPYGGTSIAQQPYNTNPVASALGTAAAAIPVGANLYDAGKWLVSKVGSWFNPAQDVSQVASDANAAYQATQFMNQPFGAVGPFA